MPYDGEFAHHESLRRLSQSDKVRKMLGDYRIREHNTEKILNVLENVTVEPNDWKPNWVFAVDGSYLPVKLENGFPGAEAVYITIASVLIDVDKIRDLDKLRPVNPVEFRKTQSAESIDCALPGCNVISQGEPSAVSSLRKSVYEVFESTRIFSDGETLLETYEALLKYRSVEDGSLDKEQKCPFGEDCARPTEKFTPTMKTSVCGCIHANKIYSTDALRFHEGMNPAGSNGAMYQEIMQVWERIWIIHFLRALETKGWLSSLRRIAIVLDGPLALFGHPAWVSQAIFKELCRLNQKVKHINNGQDILLLGIEKTGFFADHLTMLDTLKAGSQGRLPKGFTALITDEYIKKNIIFSESERLYGRQTYFGRKFFHKAMNGSLIVASVPFLSEEHRDTKKAEISQFPRLADAISVLNELASVRYPNSLIPLIQAHAEAAIPLNLGRKVLENLARQMMGGIE